MAKTLKTLGTCALLLLCTQNIYGCAGEQPAAQPYVPAVATGASRAAAGSAAVPATGTSPSTLVATPSSAPSVASAATAKPSTAVGSAGAAAVASSASSAANRGTASAGAPAAASGSAGSTASAARPATGTQTTQSAPSMQSGAAGSSAPADPDPFASLPAPSGGTPGTTPPANAMCKDIVCFDVFDCWLGILGGDGLNCNFQACDGFICK